MTDNTQDSLLSLVCSTISAIILLSWSWKLSGFLMVAASLYFLGKLWVTGKVKAPQEFKVIILGAGVSGICMGKKLNDLGIRYTILEKQSSMGGTWYENTYPGCGCDVPSHLYSFSFHKNPNWSRAYSYQAEILAYLKDTASKFGVFPHIRFGKTVKLNTWDSRTNTWTLETTEGEQFTASVIVSGVGVLHVPKYPEFSGMEVFQGEAFHTNTWRKDYSPAGKRVAVIGTGASAVQAVPCLAAMGPGSLTVFQRTPCWSPPKFDFTYPQWVKAMFAFIPLTGTLYRWFFFWKLEFGFRVLFTTSSWITKKLSPKVHDFNRKYIKATVKDQKLATKLTPTFDMGCKRITPSDTYLQAFNKEFVHLNTTKIECMTNKGIKTVDCTEHEFDTIVYATGFDLEKSSKPFQQKGLDGWMEDDYGDAPSAYLGITHHNHPNFYSLYGPGTNLGHNTIIFMVECQVNYAAQGIVKMLQSGAKSMVLKPEVLRNYLDFVQENMKGKVFADNSQCTAWYRNTKGVNWTLWPLDLVSYWWYTKSFNPKEYFVTY